MGTLYVRMLGNLSLTYGETTVGCDINRSKRVWTLLAYLIHNRKRVITSDELASLLWSEEKGSANPAGALKTTMHRVRSTLDLLEPELGHRLLLHKNGGYTFNPDIPVETDADRFEELVNAKAPGEEQLVQAMELYGGDFCAMQSSENWVVPVAAYYHNLYIQALQKAMPLLEQAGRHETGAALCRRALMIDPYAESFYQLLMRFLLAMDQRSEVVSVYEEMSKLLLSTFGIMPDQESRTLYREALRTENRHLIPPDDLRGHLQETGIISGALLCDFDFFKTLYQAEARMIARTGDAIHVVLLTVKGRMKKELAKRSLEIAMDNLEEHIRRSLRKGDVFTRCSGAQFIVMLPQANYENSVMVSHRIIDGFYRLYPHSPVRIDHFVQPLEPSTNN